MCFAAVIYVTKVPIWLQDLAIQYMHGFCIILMIELDLLHCNMFWYCMICFRSKNKWLVIHILIWLYVPTPMPLNRFYLNKEQSPIPPSFKHISVRSELMVIEYECKHQIHCTDADDASIHFIYTVDTNTRPLCSTRAVCRWRLGSCSDTR